jgi:hypothetical protein
MKRIISSLAIIAMLSVTAVVSARADGGGPFSNRSLKGAFGCRDLGLLLVGSNPGLPTVSIAREVFDGKGTVTGIAIGQIDGLVCHWTIANGTYQIDKSGVGSDAFTLIPAASDDPSCESTPTGSPDSAYFVIGEEGEPFLFFDASSLSGTCTPQDD